MTHASDQGGDSRKRVLTEALPLFVKSGYADTLTSAIARAAATSESQITRVFGDKFGVLRAVHERCWNEIYPQLAAAEADPNLAGPGERILAVARTMLSMYFDSRRDMLLIAIQHCGSADLLVSRRPDLPFNAKACDRYVEMISSLCDETVNEGTAPRGVTAASLRDTILGTITETIVGWYVNDRAGRPANNSGVNEALGAVSILVAGRASVKSTLAQTHRRIRRTIPPISLKKENWNYIPGKKPSVDVTQGIRS